MSQKIGKPRIVVKSVSIHMTRYFDWLITGLGILSELGEIEPVKFDLEPINRVLASNPTLRSALRRAMPRTFSELNQRSQYLNGEFWLGDRKVRFVFDISDDPVWFDVGQLEETDIYFKAQYYSTFPGDFAFTSKLTRNPSKAVVALQDKVKPAMLGRPLARRLDWRANLRVLKKWEEARHVQKSKTIFAYFGGVRESEMQITSDKRGRYQHPNAKRGEIVRRLRAWNDERVDARLISAPDASLCGPAIPNDAKYAEHVSRASYNVNITGLERSIPFRFIDSFITGTMIATDNLNVNWYAPFDDQAEVIQLGEMGYELPEDVAWDSAMSKMRSLHEHAQEHAEERKRYVLDRYQSLWSPEAFARYVVATLQKL